MVTAKDSYSIEKGKDYVLARITGDIAYDNVCTSPDVLMLNIVSKCNEWDFNRILIIGDSVMKYSIIKAFLMMKNRSNLGNEADWKIAVLYKNVLSFISGKYVEQAIVSKDIPIRFFIEEEEAIAWLRA